ncbi:MAG: hypothetical protein Q7W45_02805 [Bacteroidota bacterium]|nr:hypothetical protein [Bacteroidota bacterium]MDP3145816.1 hypothetical protein [Bacteroidota bacterium]MDP3558450.1 hypothetical protein [Bacteroidota bacterium]
MQPIEIDDEWENLYLFAKNLLENHISFHEIEKQLLEKTTNQILVTDIIKQIKQVHYAVKRKNGLIKLGIASVSLLVGFLITCFNFHSNQSFTVVMYSFTSIGLALLFWGLYEIIG